MSNKIIVKYFKEKLVHLNKEDGLLETKSAAWVDEDDSNVR